MRLFYLMQFIIFDVHKIILLDGFLNNNLRKPQNMKIPDIISKL